MPFRVETGVDPIAVRLVRRLALDLRPGGPGALAVGVEAALQLDVDRAGVASRGLRAGRISRRWSDHHQHAAVQRRLGMDDPALAVVDDQPGLEAERLLQ